MAESIANDLTILKQDIQSLQIQSEGIGTSKDTIDFRKQLTEMVDNISKLVEKIKTSLQMEKTNGYKDDKFKTMETQFLQLFGNLTNVTAIIRDKFRNIEMQKKNHHYKYEYKSKSPSLEQLKDDDTINLLTLKTNSYGAIIQENHRPKSKKNIHSVSPSPNAIYPDNHNRANSITPEPNEYENYKQKFYEVAANLHLSFESRVDILDMSYDLDNKECEENDIYLHSKDDIDYMDNDEKMQMIQHKDSAQSILSGLPTLEHRSSRRDSTRRFIIKLCVLISVLTVFIIIISVIIVENNK